MFNKKTNHLIHTPVVVLGKGPNALGVVRSLFAKKIPVYLVVTRKGDAAAYTRCYTQKFHYDIKDLLDEPEKCIDFLFQTMPKNAVLLPTSDQLVQWVSDHAEILSEHFQFHLPDKTLLNAILNKNSQIQLAQSTGIKLPRTLFTLVDENSERLLELQYPVIIKPEGEAYVPHIGKNQVLQTPEEAAAFLKKHSDILAHLQAQEFIPGGDDQQWVCNCCFDENADLHQAFVFQRLGLWPAHRGTTSYAVSRLNENVIQLVRKIGKKWHYTGPAMFEFKYDQRTGGYQYLEVNPRLGQCNYFDYCCGVDNAYALYLMSQKLSLPAKPEKQKTGVICHSLLADIHARLSDRQSILSIMSLYMKDLFKSHVGQYFAFTDPLPGFAATRYALKKFFQKGK